MDVTPEQLPLLQSRYVSRCLIARDLHPLEIVRLIKIKRADATRLMTFLVKLDASSIPGSDLEKQYSGIHQN